MTRTLLAALAAATILFLWGGVYFVLVPTSVVEVMRPVDNEEAVAAMLRTGLPETGVYLIPWGTQAEIADPAFQEELTERHRRGPLVMISYHEEGAEPGDPGVFLSGFLHFFLSGLLVAVLLRIALPVLAGFRQRLVFVTLVGLAAAVIGEVYKGIWFYQPWDYTLYLALFILGGWFLAGLAMAAILKPPAGAAA